MRPENYRSLLYWLGSAKEVGFLRSTKNTGGVSFSLLSDRLLNCIGGAVEGNVYTLGFGTAEWSWVSGLNRFFILGKKGIYLTSSTPVSIPGGEVEVVFYLPLKGNLAEQLTTLPYLALANLAAPQDRKLHIAQKRLRGVGLWGPLIEAADCPAVLIDHIKIS